MHAQRLGLGLAFGLFFCTSLAWAIVIETPSGKESGFLKSDDGTILKIKTVSANGESEIKSFDRTKMKIKIVYQVEEQALERLSPNNPYGYVTLAEELARHKDDPEARLRAKQLLLIAAKLRTKEFGVKSLQQMSELAETDAEKRRYQAMAFLLDPKADDKVLKGESGEAAQPAQIPARDLDDFLKALQQYRAGKFKDAEQTAKREGVDKLFSKALPGKLSLKAFVEWCNSAFCPKCREDGTMSCERCKGKGYYFDGKDSNLPCNDCKRTGKVTCPACGGKHILTDSVDDRTMRVVLQGELWALEQQGWRETPARQEEKAATNWSALVQSKRLHKVPTLSLETLLPNFDPSKQQYYHKGEWVEKKAR